MADFDEELAFAKRLAEDCVKIAKQHYRSGCAVETKKDFSPVTEADMAINWHIIQEVSRLFPEHGVVGEEQSWNESAPMLWVCDPIDGTVAYIHKIPTSMISLALIDNAAGMGRPVAAVAVNPFTGDSYWAALGQGTFRNADSVAVSAADWGSGTTLAGSSSPVHYPSLLDTANISRQLSKEGVHLVHPIGAVIKGCLVAEGSIEGVIFTSQHNWDLAAIALLVTEAGGQVTGCSGQEINFCHEIDSAIFSNGRIHEKLLDLYQKTTPC